MYALDVVFAPIIWLMQLVLAFYVHLFASTGVAIILLSFTFALILLPLQIKAQRTEQRISEKMKAVDFEIRALKEELKGEKLFFATEKIYERNGYHPIQSVAMGTSLFVMLPILLSALLLFTNTEIITDKSFLFVDDLSKPDGFWGPVNVLPILMSGVSLVTAKLRFKGDKKSMVRFFIVSIVLMIIVYDLASGLILYWIGSNTISLLVSLHKFHRL